MDRNLQVTYLIANYNNETWIKRAIQSAKNQTYPCSICVIDDGSTDNSELHILKELFDNTFSKIEENGYVKYTNGSNIYIELPKDRDTRVTGPSYARNIGIQSTIKNTDVYAILDADDENYNNKIEVCIEEFKDESVGVVYADYDILDTKTNILRREYKERYSKSRLMQDCIVHSGSLIRASYLNKVKEPSGWYDINMRTCEDFDLWIRMSNVCLISHVPQSLSLVRVHDLNSTNSVSKEIWQQNWNRIAQKIHARNNQAK